MEMEHLNDRNHSSSDPSTLLAGKASYNDGSLGEDNSDDDDNDTVHENTRFAKVLFGCRSGMSKTFKRNSLFFKTTIKLVLIVAIAVYVFFAVRHRTSGEDIRIVIVICWVTILGIVYSMVPTSCRTMLIRNSRKSRCSCLSQRMKRNLYWGILTLLMLLLIGYVLIDTAMKRPRNLISLCGVFVLLIFMFLMSKHPGKIRWRVVVWGILLQFVFGLLVLRTSWGYACFNWLSTMLAQYLDHARAGSKFIFGDSYAEHYFVFVLMPTVIMFSTTISVLYYLGVMKIFIHAISFVIRKSLGTGPMETLHATFNIFVGWAETIAVVQPLLNDMTLSELHAIMTNGFATVAGGTIAAYIIFGAPGNHLIAASFMSAPAALALSKLFYPETKLNRQKLKTPKIVSVERGVIEAASAGAINSIPLVAYIVVHVIAFFSILDFINSFMAWLGRQVGIEPPDYPVMSFQYISSYVMSPVAFLMGVEPVDARVTGRILGVKIFVNEFMAFRDLGEVIRNNAALHNYTSVYPNSTWHWTYTDDVFLNATGQTLIGGVMSNRSAVITTYALCGFSDFIALGMMIGALCSAAASRKHDILKVAPRALFTGIMSSFLTAAMAGLLME